MIKITFLGTGTSGIPIIGSKHPVCLSDDPKDNRLRFDFIVGRIIFVIDHEF